MKCVLLAGGLGARLREETEFRPKPIVPVSSEPNLSFMSYQDFIVHTGYRGENIRQCFHNFESMNSNFRVAIGSR
jgi:glucose-1-phosphate cytidylyltransferase